MGIWTLRIKAKSEAYALSDDSNSFKACSRFVIIGVIVASVDVSEAKLIVVGESQKSSSSGGLGSGFSSKGEELSGVFVPIADFDGIFDASKSNCSINADMEEKLDPLLLL